MEEHREVHLPLLPLESLVTFYAQQRPRRSGGYRIEMENIGKKIVVHNYGHGGAGVSLAPGSAIEAVCIANKSL